jgi:hypothetical protein
MVSGNHKRVHPRCGWTGPRYNQDVGCSGEGVDGCRRVKGDMPVRTLSRCFLCVPKCRAEVVALQEDCAFPNVRAVGKGVKV